MKRRRIAFKLLVFLLAGAIINVAVAWGLSLVPESNAPLTQPRFELTADEQYWLKQSAPAGFPERVVVCWSRRALGRDFFILETEHEKLSYWARPSDLRRSVLRYQFGFPVVVLEFSIWYHENGAWAAGGQRADIVGVAPFSGLGGRPLPTRINRYAFAINTIFYAAIVWMLFVLPGAVAAKTSTQARPVCIMRVFAARHDE